MPLLRPANPGFSLGADGPISLLPGPGVGPGPVNAGTYPDAERGRVYASHTHSPRSTALPTRAGCALRLPSAGLVRGRPRPRTDSRRPPLLLISLLPRSGLLHTTQASFSPQLRPSGRGSVPHTRVSGRRALPAWQLSEIPPNSLGGSRQRQRNVSPPPRLRRLAGSAGSRELESGPRILILQ